MGPPVNVDLRDHLAFLASLGDPVKMVRLAWMDFLVNKDLEVNLALMVFPAKLFLVTRANREKKANKVYLVSKESPASKGLSDLTVHAVYKVPKVKLANRILVCQENQAVLGFPVSLVNQAIQVEMESRVTLVHKVFKDVLVLLAHLAQQAFLAKTAERVNHSRDQRVTQDLLVQRANAVHPVRTESKDHVASQASP